VNPLRHTLIGQSPCFLQALHLIERVARFDVPVLLKGETGTGKELAARAIHYTSARAQGPFVPLNCGALPEALVESELYGHERGAFTDARAARAGLVAAAEGGTLFLDEVDSLSPHAQVALLRFLQDNTYRSVGGTRQHCGNVRIVAASSPRLERLLAEGQFRDDLAFRLGVFPVTLPPLRERGDDARLLAEHFMQHHARHLHLAPAGFSAASLRYLAQHGWPGNVRELDNRVQRALMLCDDGGLLELDDGAQQAEVVPQPVVEERPLPGYNAAREEVLLEFERHYLAELMRAAAGNVSEAARLAGKERRHLGRMLKRHGLGHGLAGLV
jgi:DNA-binding NtrC family response regulator